MVWQLILGTLVILFLVSLLTENDPSKGNQRSQKKSGTRKRKSGATAKFAIFRRREVAWPKVTEDNWHSGNREIEVTEKLLSNQNWLSTAHTEQRPIPKPDVYHSELSKKDRSKKQSAQVHAVRSQDVNSKPIPQKAKMVKKVKPVEHTPASKMKASLKDPIAAPCLVESTLPCHDKQVAPQCLSSLTKSACSHSEEKGKPHIKQSRQTQIGSSPATKSKSSVPLKAGSTGLHESSSSLTKSACNHSEEKGKPHIKQSRQTQIGSSPATKSKSPVPLKAGSTGLHESSSSLTKSACNHSEEKGKPHIKQSRQTQTTSLPATKSKQPISLKAKSTRPHESSVQFLHAEQDISWKKEPIPFELKDFHCSQLLNAKLSTNNYRKKFHQLLRYEEEEHERIIKNRCDGVYRLHVCQKKSQYFGYITADHLDGDKISYAEQASAGKVILVLPGSRNEGPLILQSLNIQGSEYTKGRECIYLELHDHDVDSIVNLYPKCIRANKQIEKVKVEFVLKHSYFKRLHKAIDQLSDEVISKLVPCNPSDFSIQELNGYAPVCTHMIKMVKEIVFLDRDREKGNIPNSQMSALCKILQIDSQCKAPVLIVGSFGTGKTRLLARTAYQTLYNDRSAKVLVCAHHQRSVDSLMEDYFLKMIKEGWKCNTMVRLIPEGWHSQYKHEYEDYYKTISQMKVLDKSSLKLVLTTFSSSLLLLQCVGKGHFTHILLDEGAQSREPETIAPLCLANKNTKIVIAGDHKQVGPSVLVLGEKAREYGLKLSLLERLHRQYSKFEASKLHCITLSTNFRCHHALLSLPSYLFYGSTLLTAAEATTQLHPDAGYPIHFICSSIDNNILQIKDSINETEANFVLSEVRKYVEDWPEVEWGPKNLEDICVVAATANQKSYILSQLEGEYEDIKDIVVLTTYLIQGREFQAIFLSTTEPIDSNGLSMNPTKSPCGQYVFNTVITRAKSLVVCVGNPFILLRVEKRMNNERLVWKDYLRRCLIAKTLHAPCSQKEAMDLTEGRFEVLQKELLFSENKICVNEKDSILQSYQRMLRKNSHYKGFNSHFSHSSSLKDEKYQLQIKTSRTAVCVPLSSLEKPVIINGEKNRRGAFHGDIVTVNLLENERNGQKYGRITGVVESHHPLKYVCRADNVINFYPIDRLVTGIVNLLKFSRNALQCKPKESSESQKKYITVFEESSLDDDADPQIKELLPLELAQSLLFVVKVLRWLPEYRKPLGAVIEALPRTNNMFIMEKLLTVAHDIHHDDQTQVVCVDQQLSVRGLNLYENAFTIDPTNAINLDDALRLERLNQNTFKMSVLIADVARHIKKGSELDEIAQQHATSVYYKNGKKCLHMLRNDDHVSTEKLSLLPEECRDVLVVSATVKIKKMKVVEICTDGEPEIACVKSCMRLTYMDARKIMKGECVRTWGLTEQLCKFNASGPLKMRETLQMLYNIAMKLRTDRIGNAAHYYDVTDPGEEENWQSHLLVSELMIWANSKIANFLCIKTHMPCIIRRQLPPADEDKEKVKQNHNDAFAYSMSLKALFFEIENANQPLLVPSSTISLLKNAYESGDLAQLKHLLSNEKLYPQLAIAHSAIKSISSRAEYIALNSLENEKSVYRHYGLNLDFYTHFTSPIRRYIDIIIQRIVNAHLSESNIQYTEEELQQLANYLNIKQRAASKFERDMKKVELAALCEDSLEQVEAYLTRSLIKEHKFELCIPSNKYGSVLFPEDTGFDLSNLNCYESKESYITWRVICVPFKPPDFLLASPMVSQFNECSEKDCVSSCKSFIKATVFETMKGEETKPDEEQKKERKLYLAELDFGTREINLENWRACNEFVCNMEEKSLPIQSLQDLIKPLSDDPRCSKRVPIPSFSQSPVICYDATRRFDLGETVNVWIGKNLTKPISSPSIQLLEVAPSVKICLQHIKCPVVCFSDTQLCLTSKSSYHSKHEYVELWSKALLAEASHDAVNTKCIVLYKDVMLNWPKLVKPDNCLDNVYFKPKRELYFEIGGKQKAIGFISKSKIKSGDLVCARYTAPNAMKDKVTSPKILNAVYHFVVQNVQAEENKELICIRSMGEYGCRVSPSWKRVLTKKKKPTCELQIIQMPQSFNRLFHRLKCMESEKNWSKLAIAVGLGRNIKPLGDMSNYTNILDSYEMATSLWKDKSKKLNHLQKEAVESALQNRFSLILGPPGTGKSIVGAHIAYVFAMGNRKASSKLCVLYCGPSNKAVDVVHDYFLALNKTTKDSFNLLRLYGRVHEKLDFKDRIYVPKFDEDDQLAGKCQERFSHDALHHKIRELKDDEINRMEVRFKNLSENNMIPSVEEIIEYKEAISSIEKEVLKEPYDVILCTCNETCSKRLLKCLQGRIAQCIVDECGMSQEPETLAAISLTEHAVLIGDHKQLQPVVKYSAARECGLVRSLFERYAESGGDGSIVLTMLKTQYRMHPKICEIPSQLYYNDELVTDDSVINRSPLEPSLAEFWPRGLCCPLMFYHVEGKEEDQRNSEVYKGNVDAHSKSNHEEALKTIEIIKSLVEKHHLNTSKHTDIAVLTPYAAQRELIREMLKNSRNSKISKVVVSSIVECQGDEYNIVILNTVRSLPVNEIYDHEFVQPDQKWMRDNLGFLTDSHQVNVGLTRAKHGLIIIGNQVLLKYDKDWKEIIERYNKYGCIVGTGS